MKPQVRPSTDRQPAFTIGHIVRQAGWAGGMDITGLGLRLLLTVAIARLAGPTGLGVYTLALAVGQGVLVVSKGGLDQTLLRYVASYLARGERAAAAGVTQFAILASAALGTLAGILLFVASEAIANAMREPDLAAGLRIIAVIVPLWTLGQVSVAGLRALHDVRLAAFLEKVGVPGGTLLVLFLTLPLWPPYLGPLISAAGAISITSVIGILAFRRTGVAASEARQYAIQEWTVFAIPMGVDAALAFLLTWGDQVLLGYFTDAATVGVYSAANRLAMLATVPLLATNLIFGPAIAALQGQSRGQLQELFSRLTWLLVGVSVLVTAAIATSGQVLLAILGSEFELGYPLLLVLLLGQLVNGCTGSSGLVLSMTGRVGWRLVNGVVGASTNIALTVILVPNIGAMGAAVASALSLALINTMQVLQVRYLLGMWAYSLSGLTYWIDFLPGAKRRRGQQ